MPRKLKYNLALVTAPNLKIARKLARSALVARLAACVNLVPRVESHYWWQGKIESGPEVLMIFKTVSGLLSRLEQHVIERHPYDTPEFIVLSIGSGNEAYLSWLAESLGVKSR
ncbi:MAG TPA: divalent-cation tolerance protein CutA [Verrucomicrobiae bacterium]|nr:divalent-cation tolerance protein CutA [Verrucomicrobiae bacterium]